MFFVLQVCLIGNVIGADKEGMYLSKGVSWKSCNEFLQDYSSTGIVKKKNSEYSYHTDFGGYIGWFQGYMTRVNYISPGKKDHFSDVSIFDVLGWVGSWCRENPNKHVANAMDTYTKFKLRSYFGADQKASNLISRKKLIYEPISKPTFDIKRPD